MSKRKLTNSSYEDNTTNEDNSDGYETDATILNEDYDSETERRFYDENIKKRKIPTPSTPEPIQQGPEPSTEVLKKTGSPIFTRFEGMYVPYTRNDSKLGQIPLDRYGEPIKWEELPVSIQRNLFEGGLAKSRKRRRAKKSSRKRKTNRRRKTRSKK
jgi:hypothetical protein